MFEPTKRPAAEFQTSDDKTAKIDVGGTDCLLIIDVMPTFMPGGGLPVPEGDQIVMPINQATLLFEKRNVFATLELHPPGHVSQASSYVGLKPIMVLKYPDVLGWDESMLAPHAAFKLAQLKSYLMMLMPGGQTLWPDHGIDGTAEAVLHPLLNMERIGRVWLKAQDPACDSPSAARDMLRRRTGLSDELDQLGIKRVFVCGLAFNYCVEMTAIDLVGEGFNVYVIEDLCRAVPNFNPGARDHLLRKGVTIINSADLKKAA